MQPVFDAWDLTPQPLKPRSRLYAPTPEGIGTAFVESLSSYLVRLAEAHAVSTSDLISRELSRHARAPIDCSSCSGIDGPEARAAHWVQAVERATLRSDLRYLTLLPFKKLFPTQLLLRKIHAWCPECYQDMSAAGVVYDPLPWCLRLVEACPRHRRLLVTTCSQCNQSHRPLCAVSRTGCCPWCRIELRLTSGDPGPVPTEYQLASADAMGQLLARAPVIHLEQELPDRVRDVLTAYIAAFGGGNCAAVAELVECDRNALADWLLGPRRPRVDALFRVWYRLKLPISVLFSPAGTPLPWETGTATCSIERKRKVVPRHSREQIRKALEQAVHEQPPPNLTEVTRRLGYVKTRVLHNADHALCVRIVKRYHQSSRWASWSKRGAKPTCELPKVKQVLEDYLTAEGQIPPPLDRIAASLGYVCAGYIRKKFPDLCRTLREKIVQKRRERISAIKPALEQALQENSPPTLGELARRVGLSPSHLGRLLTPASRQKLKRLRHESIEASNAELRRKLKASLSESPPPRREEVYMQLGINATFARNHFSELHLALSARYWEYRKEQRGAREEATRKEIPAIVQSLHEQGICPSVNNVRDLLKNGCALQWKAFGEAVYDARNSLGID